MKTVFAVIGKPNSGKGTFLGEIQRMFDVRVIECGEVCRHHASVDSDLYRRAKAHMDAVDSKLWPTEVLMEALSPLFVAAVEEYDVIFLDGFLRREDQVEYIERFVVANCIDSFVVIEVDATDVTCIRRAKKRGREDDAHIEKRLFDYHQFTEPAIDLLMRMEIEPRPERIRLKSTKEGLAEVTPFVEGLMKIYNLQPAVPSIFAVV